MRCGEKSERETFRKKRKNTAGFFEREKIGRHSFVRKKCKITALWAALMREVFLRLRALNSVCCILLEYIKKATCQKSGRLFFYLSLKRSCSLDSGRATMLVFLRNVSQGWISAEKSNASKGGEQENYITFLRLCQAFFERKKFFRLFSKNGWNFGIAVLLWTCRERELASWFRFFAKLQRLSLCKNRRTERRTLMGG